MTLRQKVQVSRPISRTSGNWSFTDECYPVGTGKTINAEIGGKFVPGRFKYTSCEMITGTCQAPTECYRPWSGLRIDGPVLGYLLRNSMNFSWWYTKANTNYSGFLYNAARIKSANKRFDNAFAGGVFLAELKESLSLIFNPIKGGLKLLRSGIRPSRRFRNRARRKEYLSSWWLEARYGWIPLAHDIADIHERICLGVQRASQFFVTHGSERQKMSSCTRKTLFEVAIQLQVDIDMIETWDTRVRATHGWNYVVGHENGELLSLMGLHYHDIPGVAWESVPFSFALDWWFKVGDFLQYLRPAPWLQKLGEGVSITTTYDRLYVPLRARASIGRIWTSVAPPVQSLKISQQSHLRTIPSAPVMAPIFDPRFESVKHLADAAALTIQKLWR